jgi:hypothetical protein
LDIAVGLITTGFVQMSGNGIAGCPASSSGIESALVAPVPEAYNLSPTLSKQRSAMAQSR